MNKLSTLRQRMKTADIPQILISEASAISDLLGSDYASGERFIGLLVTQTKAVLFLNRLLISKEDPDVLLIPIHDNDLAKDMIIPYLQTGPLGLSKRTTIEVHDWFQEMALVDATDIIDATVAIKQADQLAKLRLASAKNDAIMEQVATLFVCGVREIDIAKKITQWQSTAPLSGNSFAPIVAFGSNIADPHGIPTDRALRADEAIVIDMGGLYEGYCSDMTRTFIFGDDPHTKKLYTAVYDANMSAIAAIRPGVRFATLDAIARDIIERAGYGSAFTHRLGHGIGTQVHEPFFVKAHEEKTLEPGMCFSIEPGIYLPNIGGVRIEDLVCVTQTGVEVLNHFPKQIDAITLAIH